jgi:hypothetical protein
MLRIAAFLSALVVAALAGGLRATPFLPGVAPAVEGIPIRLGVCDWTIGKTGDPAALALAGSLGCDGVQVSLVPKGDSLALADPPERHQGAEAHIPSRPRHRRPQRCPSQERSAGMATDGIDIAAPWASGHSGPLRQRRFEGGPPSQRSGRRGDWAQGRGERDRSGLESRSMPPNRRVSTGRLAGRPAHMMLPILDSGIPSDEIRLLETVSSSSMPRHQRLHGALDRFPASAGSCRYRL